MFAVDDGARPFGSHIAVSITNACPLECGHCISRSGPKTNQPSPDFPATIREFVADSEFPIKFVSMTGGEPFHDLHLLGRAVQALADLNIAVGAVTSSFWAKTPETALRTLEGLPGLKSLALSCDVFHKQYVKVAFVKNAYFAAKRLGIKVKIRGAVHINRTSDEMCLIEEIEQFADTKDLEYQKLVPYGRAENDKTIEEYDEIGEFEIGEFCPTGGPHLYYNGHVIPCCNSIVALPEPHPLTLGNVFREGQFSVKDRIIDNLLMMTLKLWGIEFFKSHLGDKFKASWSICDVCYHLCSDKRLWEQLRCMIESPEHKVKTYSLAFYHFGLKEARSRLVSALDELARQRDLSVPSIP